MKVGIVCGYGNLLDDNLINYIGCVVKSANKYEIDCLVLSGGCSFTTSNTSEAQLMLRLIRQDSFETKIFLEEKALTSLHNLLYSKQLVEKLDLTTDLLYIFCDSIRYFKVWLLSKIIWKGKPVKIIKVGRKEPLIIYLVQLPSIAIQCLGAISPKVEKILLASKQKWIDKYR